MDQFVEAAKIAHDCGADGIDFKNCHGYLGSQLVRPYNDRKWKYGGSFENRTRLLVETVDRVRAELGDKGRVVTRLGIYDAIPYPYGWGVNKDEYTKADLTEPKMLIGTLKDRGVDLIDITVANPYYNPHVGRPFNEPIVGGYAEPEHPLVGVARLVDLTAQIQKTYPDMALVGTGYSWLRTLFANVGAAVGDMVFVLEPKGYSLWYTLNGSNTVRRISINLPAGGSSRAVKLSPPAIITPLMTAAPAGSPPGESRPSR